LFFLVRDDKGKVACDVQGIIMALVLVLTLLYQIWLMNHLSPLFKYSPLRLEIDDSSLLAEAQEDRTTESRETHQSTEGANSDPQGDDKHPSDLSGHSSSLSQNNEWVHEPELSNEVRPTFWQRQSSHRSQDLKAQQEEDVKSAERILARINRPLDEARLGHLEKKLASAEIGIGGYLLPRRRDIEKQMLDDPISKIIMQHIDELENLDPEERDMLISVAFTHPVLRKTSPSVWIPRDDLGVSDDEVRRTRDLSGDLVIDNRGAYFNRKLKVQVDKPPPDMSEFALILAEL
jgi:hypothetical protein